MRRVRPGYPLPTSNLDRYTYDANGNLTSHTDANATATNYLVDALNRVIRKTYSDGAGAVTPTDVFCYDGSGSALSVPSGTTVTCTGAPSPGPHSARRLTFESNANSSNSFTGFDAMGRVTSHNQITGGVTYPFTYGYNLAGGLESEGYPSGRQISMCYDVAGRMSKVSGSQTSYASAVGYQLDGQMASATFANGLTETYGYSTDRLQLNSIQTAKPNVTPLLLLNFSYTGTAGNNGNLQGQTITALENVTGHGPMQVVHAQSYTYDGVNRLAGASETETTPPTGDTVQPWTMSFGFDAYGNQWTASSLTDPASPTQRTDFNQSKNQLQISGDTYYSAGQLKTAWDPVQLKTMYYTYYAGGQEYTFTEAANGATYYYDPEGRRTQKVLSGTKAGTVTFVYDAMGQLTAEYSTIANTESGTQYLTDDHLGSTRLITDNSGNCLNQWDYFPFGGQIATGTTDGNREYQCSTTTGETLKFTGKERGDGATEGGLDYFGARYFSSDQGRFTSPDPMVHPAQSEAGFEAFVSWPQRWNKYAYVSNNPLQYTDPTGAEQVSGCIGKTCYNFVTGQAKPAPSATESLQAAAIPVVGMAAAAGGGWLAGTWLGRAAAAAYLWLATPSGQQTAAAVADAISPPGTSNFSAMSAGQNFGLKGIQQYGELLHGNLANGAEVAASFSKSGENLAVNVFGAWNPKDVKGNLGTLKAIYDGAIDAAKASGASLLTLSGSLC